MIDSETQRGIPGKTDLTLREWRFLNRYSQEGGRLYEKQLKKIDELRRKYPPGSPAQTALDIFDPRTGVANEIAAIVNEALSLRNSGDIEGSEAKIQELKKFENNPQEK